MNWTRTTAWMALLMAAVVSIVVATGTWALAAEPPQAPPVSRFAPADDLVDQVKYYLKRLDEAVASEEDYKDYVERIAKDADTLTVIALALGLHDTENQYKAAAPAMIKATTQLAAAKDYATAKAAVAIVQKAAAEKSAGAAALKWEKVASLKQIMLAVPVINTQLKRNARFRRPKGDGPKAAGRSAVIAAIGQASLYHSGDTEKPNLATEWYKYCIQMRDAAAEMNAVAHRADQPDAKTAARAAITKLAKSCDDCHTVFHQAALGKEDVEE
jgi:hypothetical protein